MKEKKLKRNNKFLYCPGSSDLKILQNYHEKIFVFKKYYNNNDYCNFSYIFAENEQIANIYSTVEEYEHDLDLELHCQQPIKNLSLFKENTILIQDLSFVHPYNEKRLTKILNIYIFLSNKKNKYVKAISDSKLYCKQQASYFETSYVKNCRRTLCFVKLKYLICILTLKILRLLKIFPYIIIFIKDTFLSTVQTYKDYKSSEADVQYYSKNTFLGLSNAEKEKALEEAKKIYENKKKIYLETNKSIFALAIALFTLVFSLVQNVRSNLNIQKQNSEIQETIVELKIEKQELNNKILIQENELNKKNEEIELYKQLYNFSFSQKKELEKIDKNIETTKDEIIEYLK